MNRSSPIKHDGIGGEGWGEGGPFLVEIMMGAVVGTIKGLLIPGAYQNLILLTLLPSERTWHFVCIFCLVVTTFCL